MSARHVSASIVCILFLAPSPLAASGWDDLEAGLDLWEEIESIDEEDMRRDELERMFQESADLFPDLSGETTTGRLDELSEARTAGILTIVVDGQNVPLRDVPRQSWFAPYIRSIAEIGLVSGYRDAEGRPTGEFGPQNNVTVAEMAKVVVIGAGIDTGACAPPQNLTASGTWASSFIGCAEGKGWSLYGDGQVDINRKATRLEVVSTVLQAFEVSGIEVSEEVFTDVTPSTLFASLVARAKQDGVISGYTDAAGIPTGLFGPDDPVTRAEFAKIVTVSLEVYGQKD